MNRKSIVVEGFNHGPQPIPAACRIGNLIMTGGVHGMDPATETLPDGAEKQARHMFSNLKRIMEAAGGSLDDVIKVTVYVKDPSARNFINKEWLLAFPDEKSRPARHTFQNDALPMTMVVQCDAVAVLTS